MAMENGTFTGDFLINTSIHRGFSTAMFDDPRGYIFPFNQFNDIFGKRRSLTVQAADAEAPEAEGATCGKFQRPHVATNWFIFGKSSTHGRNIQVIRV